MQMPAARRRIAGMRYATLRARGMAVRLPPIRGHLSVTLLLIALAASAFAATRTYKFGVNATVATACTIVVRPQLLSVLQVAPAILNDPCESQSGEPGSNDQLAVSSLSHDAGTQRAILTIEF